MSQSLEKLKRLLAELFQLDQADLDFGIYRIMNAKRDEITRFLDNDLLPQVHKAFQAYESENRVAIEGELAEAIEKAKQLGADPETLPRVKDLRAKLSQAVDVTALENEVYSHLYNFFRRYYQEGDFISLRRYKEGVYAIPYEGQEVKLHWANHDQYYIKTAEYLRDYTFRLPTGKRVHFKLVEADTEKDNNRPQNGKERRFILSEEQPLAEENGELVVRFEYRSHPDKTKQADLNATAVARILNQTKGFDDWRMQLASPRPTEKNASRTLLEKHLTDYTARNTFDYFIHKDLGGFLRRELDFYIKNEVMHLDDVESETVPRVGQYLSKIKAIRRIAHKIIDFVAQTENFQKKLWLKKKFVVDTQYCITLDRIFAIEDEKERNWLVDQIIGNDDQREEWVSLCAIDELKGDLTTPGYSKPLKREFLKAHPTLVVDTRHFTEDFKRRLLGCFEDLDEQTDGLLIHSENFQALSLMLERFRASVGAVYIDPPYNTFATKIIYKNDYEHSSWLSLLENRVRVASHLVARNGITCTTVDDYEFHRLMFVLQNVFGASNHLATVAIRNNPSGRSTVKGFAINHEYGLFFCRDANEAIVGRMPHTETQRARYDESDKEGHPFEWENFRKSSAGSFRFDRPRQYFPLYCNRETLSLRIPRMEWQQETHTWKMLEEPGKLEFAIWPIDSAGRERVWRYGIDRTLQVLDEARVEQNRDGFQVYTKKYLQTRGTLPRTWWDKAEYSARDNGTRALADLFGSEKLFDFPKAPTAVMDSIRVCSPGEGSFVLDYFAGSGTTGHAVIDLNRQDDEGFMFILVEMGEYFYTVLLPRIKKVIFTPEWKAGKPERMATQEEAERSPRIVKVIRLESYEDALNNLELKRTGPQQTLLEQQPGFREDYILRYMLDVESRGSASLLNIDRFEDPFNYKLNIATGSAGETKPTVVDLVETFNFLIGLRVKTVDDVRGVRVVTGTNPQGERVIIIWRWIKELDNDGLDAWFRKQEYNTKDQEFDIIYVNGDNNLENLRKPHQTWKVRLLEEEFRRLMFDVQDV